MNNKTLVTIAVVAGLGVVGYFAWKAYQNRQNVAQQPTTGNATPAPNGTAQIINASTNALNTVTDILGV